MSVTGGNGTGSSVKTPKSQVLVQSVDDLSNIDSSKVYVIDGAIDLGSTTITVPAGGISITGGVGSREVSKLFSTENNHTMFDGNVAGNVYMTEMSLCSNGTGSKLFDLTNDGNGSFEFQNVNFGGFGVNDQVTSLGNVTDYRQGFFDGCGIYFVNDGFTISGAWGGFVLQNSNTINPTTAMTLLKEGTSLTFDGSVRSNLNFLSVNSASVFTDFQESNFLNNGAFSLNNLRTSVTNAIPNISASSVFARFRNCDGIKNTYVGGDYEVTTSATTVIAAPNTPVKMAGTTTYSNMDWFTQTTNNAFVYSGTQLIEVDVFATLSFDGGAGDSMNCIIRQWDDSASTYIDIGSTAEDSAFFGDNALNIVVIGTAILENNDRIEIWVENTSDATDITTLVGGRVKVSERPS